MGKITIVARMGIKPENVAKAKALAARGCKVTADGHGEFMGALMALIDSLEFFVLGTPDPEHLAALSRVPGAQFYSEVARIAR